MRKLLLVEDDDTAAPDASSSWSAKATTSRSRRSRTAEEASTRCDDGDFDCMVVDLVLPGDDGIRLLEKVRAKSAVRELPVIVYTGKDLTPEDERAR